MSQNAIAAAGVDDGEEVQPSVEKRIDIDSLDFIVALAALVRGSVDRLEKTAGSVTGSLMARASKVDRDMVVALQDFDRLQQEFVALSNALNRSAGALRESSTGHRFPAAGCDAIAAIAVSDLPERLASHLRQVAESAEMAAGGNEIDNEDEEVF